MLALQVMMGNAEAREKLITANMRFVISRAHEYVGQGAPIEDLIQEGYVGLCKAVDRYDPLKGYKFITFASWWIWQAIIQFLTNYGGTVRIPANKTADLRKIRKAEDKLSRDLGRFPTLNELEEELPDVNVSSLVPWMSITFNKHTNEHGDGNVINELDELDILAKSAGLAFPQPDDELMAKGFLDEIAAALNTLPERESKILRLYYGIGDITPLTLEEIGELFDLTRERIRQIKNNGLKRLAEKGNLKHSLG